MTKHLLFIALLTLGCSNSQPATSGQNETSKFPSAFILDEVIVKLQTGVRLEDVLKDFEPIALMHKEDISSRSGLYLLSYDMDRIKPEQILEHLKAHEDILEAQFNKRLEERD
jgi:hypothetical protein